MGGLDRCPEGWMDGLDGWTGGWIDGRMDGRADR